MTGDEVYETLLRVAYGNFATESKWVAWDYFGGESRSCHHGSGYGYGYGSGYGDGDGDGSGYGSGE